MTSQQYQLIFRIVRVQSIPECYRLMAYLQRLSTVVFLGSLWCAALLFSSPVMSAIGSNSQVGTGDTHSCVLTTGGGVQCWGNNGSGRLGDGTTINRSYPVNVVGLNQGVVQIAVGGLHTCALTTAGGVKCWGLNSEGQLGAGDSDPRQAPVDVDGLQQGVLSITAGFTHTCALTTQGSALCWGANNDGQLGDSSTFASNVPVQVTGMESGAKALSAGEFHTCALNQAGEAMCWGRNAHGQLGNGDTVPGTNALEPEPVQGLGNGVQSLSAGGFHVCVVTAVGGAKCWGRNGEGQLGNDDNISSSTPVDVFGLGTGILRVAAGYLHSCAVTDSGAAKCWGWDSFGQLGDGDAGGFTDTPTDVVFLESGVLEISGNDYHTCALTLGGGVQCWGFNSTNQLGNGTSGSSDIPLNVLGLSGLTSVAVGGRNACALNTNGALQCWGENALGQLGNDAAPVESPAPYLVGEFHSGIKAVSHGGESGCLVNNEGAVVCWGSNFNGELGIGTNEEGPFPPTAVAGMDSDVTSISVGGTHVCAVKAGAVYCWGNNSQGQLGLNPGSFQNAPVAVAALASGVQSVSVGFLHSCALLANGDVRCWGDNTPGSLGNGTNTDSHTPVTPTGISNAIALSTGNEHTCVILNDNTGRCWGKGISGQLGQASLSGSASPVTVSGLTTAIDIALGGTHSCAILIDGTAQCWGANGSGRLGYGIVGNNYSVPGTVTGLSNVKQLAGGNESTCAAIENGEIHCWGNNASGQLGRAGTFSVDPVLAQGFNGLESMDIGFDHGCLLTIDGTVRCWGNNNLGQTGSGDFANRDRPTAVSDLIEAKQVATGVDHTCVLLDDSSVRCWGENFSGQLGVSPGGPSNVPVQVPGIGPRSLSAGFGFNCAQVSSGTMQCWGRNDFGQLGNNSTSETGIHTPVMVSFEGSPFNGLDDFVSGYLHSCALRSSDIVYCWGRNNYGQLGVGDEVDRLIATPIAGLTGVVKLYAGGYHTCALIDDGSARCWGRNFAGQLGTGIGTDLENTPQTVTVMTDITRMALGSDHTCAINSSGAMGCWGWNGYGQLGDPAVQASSSDSPVDVVGLGRGVVDVSAGEGHTCAITDTGILKCWGLNDVGQVGDATNINRLQWADVFPIKQSIGFMPPATASTTEPILLSAITSSGLDPSFDSWTPSTCLHSADTVTPLSNGYCGIRASQVGNEEYAAAVQERRLIFTMIEILFRDGFESIP